MMKYIKTFEAITPNFQYKPPDNIYWKIRTDSPWFDISLDKIGMTEDEKKYYSDEIKFYIGNETIYIGLDYRSGTIGSEYYFSVAKEDFGGYVYGGEIEKEITQEDLEKWYFENDTKKYNI